MDKKEKIFEVRKDFLNKVYSWQVKVLYGFMLFFGAILIGYIAKSDFENYFSWIVLSILVFVFLSILCYVEYFFVKRTNDLHYELIQDIRNNSLDNFSKYSFKDYFHDSFPFYK